MEIKTGKKEVSFFARLDGLDVSLRLNVRADFRLALAHRRSSEINEGDADPEVSEGEGGDGGGGEGVIATETHRSGV